MIFFFFGRNIARPVPHTLTLLLLKTGFDESKLRLRPDTFAVNSLMYFWFQPLKVAAKKIKVLFPEKCESAYVKQHT